MAKILLIETATECCSAAMMADGVLICQVEEPNASSHAALLTLQIEQCVRDSGIALMEIDAVAFSLGPGSYTSLRVGASVAKGICYALDKPLLAIDTLQALADASLRLALADGSLDLHEDVLLAPMIDARRQEVWMGVYDRDLAICVAPQPLILENNSFESMLMPLLEEKNTVEKILISGNGGIKLTSASFEKATATYSKIIKCHAAHLQYLAQAAYDQQKFEDVAYIEPFYMKAPNITAAKVKI